MLALSFPSLRLRPLLVSNSRGRAKEAALVGGLFHLRGGSHAARLLGWPWLIFHTSCDHRAGCLQQAAYTNENFFSGMISTLFFVPASVFVINKAIAAPPNLSISRGVLGWFIGFFTPYEVVVALNIAAGVNFPACLLRLF